MTDALLIELLTEELPPKSLLNLGETFAQVMFTTLQEMAFMEANPPAPRFFATPRRLAVYLQKVKSRVPDHMVVRRGPALAAGMEAGKPTSALLGFAKSCGVSVDDLQKDGQRFIYQYQAPGPTLESGVATAMQAAIAKLPIKKLMRWGAGVEEFVRPVHGVVVLHGPRVLPGKFLGRDSGRITWGHRFMSNGPIEIPHASDYEVLLEKKGWVIADFSRRRALIEQGIRDHTGSDKVMADAKLVEEVTALVEYPAVYQGEFNAAFLSVPQECLILSMKQHQRYFPLKDAKHNLAPRFLLVSNIKTDAAQDIIHGNERVLRARLADAQFFFTQDKKIPLAERVPHLAQVVYHNKLGSQLQRVHRIRELASVIAVKLQTNEEETARAAYLCKADLLTDMVGEFPELQGIMGGYYALADGEKEGVSIAIKHHYLPRFADDALPSTVSGLCLALADKLDSLVGMAGLGLMPSGDKDPFGLRRHALGCMRLLEGVPQNSVTNLDLVELLQYASSQYAQGTLKDGIVDELHAFMLERYRNYLALSHGINYIDAVLVQMPRHVDEIRPRVLALQDFARLPAAPSLAGANKRISNILRKAPSILAQVQVDLLEQDEERALYSATQAMRPVLASFMGNGDYRAALFELATIAEAVDAFFDKVLVMAEQPEIQANRLALLRDLNHLMNQVGEIKDIK